jgi:hypothetical protein
MFYDKEQVDNHLNCKNCNKRFDLPRLLTCGEVICETCLNNIKNVCNVTDEIKCPFCCNVHNMPKNGFPIQKVLMNLLKIEPLNNFRGVLVEELDDATKELSQRLNVLNMLNENSKNKIKEHGIELRKIINACAEKKRNEVLKLEAKLNNKMDSYEKEAFEQMKLIMQKYFEENEEKFKTWNELAEKTTFENVDKLLEAIHDISGLMKEITPQEEVLKKLMDDLEIIYFSDSKGKIYESTLGVLKGKNEDLDNNNNVQQDEILPPLAENNNDIQCKTQ